MQPLPTVGVSITHKSASRDKQSWVMYTQSVGESCFSRDYGLFGLSAAKKGLFFLVFISYIIVLFWSLLHRLWFPFHQSTQTLSKVSSLPGLGLHFNILIYTNPATRHKKQEATRVKFEWVYFCSIMWCDLLVILDLEVVYVGGLVQMVWTCNKGQIRKNSQQKYHPH